MFKMDIIGKYLNVRGFERDSCLQVGFAYALNLDMDMKFKNNINRVVKLRYYRVCAVV